MRRLFLAAAVLATSGCMSVPPPGADHAHSAYSQAMGTCTGALDVAQVVRVVIPDHFDPADVPRDVTYSDPAKGDAAHDEAAPPEGGGSAAPFDVDLRPLDQFGGRRAKIEIILKDPRYGFFEWRDGAGRPVAGVANGETGNPFGFCDAQITSDSGWPAAVFYVRIHASSGLPDADQPYRIGIAPRLHPDLGYIIDPNVKNRG